MFFPLGLSNFGGFAWFPFDKGQSIAEGKGVNKRGWIYYVM